VALTDQMIRASRLDVNLYEEVERDTTQTQNALYVVVISAVASAIAAAIGAGTGATGGTGVVLALLAGLIAPIVGWVVGAGCIYFIGTRLFGGTATWGEVMRTIGFAQSPGVLNILSFIPFIGGLISLVVGVWIIVADVIAIRQALDVSTGKAIVAGIIGGLIGLILSGFILGLALAPAAILSGATRP
jgi:hypothetical protein